MADKAINHGQAQPGALPHILGGEERIKNAGTHFFRHAHASVRNLHNHPRTSVILTHMAAQKPCNLPHGNTGFTALRLCIYGVNAQAEHRQFKLHGVCPYWWQRFFGQHKLHAAKAPTTFYQG